MFYEVVPVGKVGALTYDFHGELRNGQIVLVPLGSRQVPGVVIKKVVQPIFKTKTILKILYTEPLPQHLLTAAKFVQDYYMASYGDAMSLMLPNGVQKKRRVGNSPKKTEQTPVYAEIQLNSAQKNALKQLQEVRSATRLLLGVTGSGKTNIYLKMAEEALKQQKSVIVLVPEIALTGQLVRVFQDFFGNNIVLIHSKQTEAERHLIFDSLLKTKTPKVIIGPRSALFAPVNNLGLIVVDEAHEGAYYQENPPKYSAIRVASTIAKTLGIPLILGSATPSVEDFYLAKQHDALVKLTKKAKTAAVNPEITILDLKERVHFRKNRYFSDNLLGAIKKNLDKKRQTLIFHNRRGSSTLSVCEKCGEELLCPHCFLPLTLHADNFELVCHACGYTEKVPMNCPKCGAPGIVHKGFGTKMLEAELKKLFPKARIKRFDADNKKDEGMDAIYDEVREGEVDILVGTQMLAKGLDLPKLATVGIVQADAGLALPDFAAEERVFQLITQVIGRVGRGHLDAAEVFIQTFRPDHPVIQYAINEDYSGFVDYLTNKRRVGKFPPFRFLMRLEITMKTEATVLKKVKEAAAELSKNSRLSVSSPQPAFHERTDKGFTWQIIVRSKSRKALLEACKDIDKGFKVTLDPPSLL